MFRKRVQKAPEGFDNGDLRTLYAQTFEAGSSEHLDEATWERFACHELTPFERERVLDHITACPLCMQIRRGLAMLQTEAREFDPDVPLASDATKRAGWRRLPWWSYASAAAVLVLVILVPPAVRRGVTSLGTTGNIRSADQTRGLTAASRVTVVDPLGTWSGPPARFRWQLVPGPRTYRVRLYSEDGMLLWTSAEVSGSSIERPASVSLKPGKYYWQVTALRDGETVAESTLSSFSVR